MLTPTARRRRSHFFVLGWLGERTESIRWAVRESGDPEVVSHLSYDGSLPVSQVVDPTR